MSFLPADVADQVISSLTFNDQGLIPAIAQQFNTGEVLMMAWMNAESIAKTFDDGIVHYYSRSRQALWKKGETSGHIQVLKDFRYDCDSDTILLMIDQQGVACHTGRRSCFYKQATAGGLVEDAGSPVPQTAS